MRKVILFNMVSVDGFFEGPGNDISWHRVDDEFNEFALGQLDSAGGLLFGRKTYMMMAAYWPTADAMKNDPLVAEKMNAMPKIVFSHTLEKAGWSNTLLVKENASDEIIRLKKQQGKDLFIFGSANLAGTIIRDGLIDEFRIMVNPVLLGKGTPLFRNVNEKFEHLKTRTFGNGNVLLSYMPAGDKDR